MDYAILKITASWSRSMSLTNVLITDLRQISHPQQMPWKKVNQAIQVISQKWEPRDSNIFILDYNVLIVLPPYIE